MKTQRVFRYLKQGITVVYNSIDAERVTSFAVKRRWVWAGWCQSVFFFFFISSVADLFGLLKKIKVNGCKCPVTERSVFLQLSFSFTNYLLAAVSFP